MQFLTVYGIICLYVQTLRKEGADLKKIENHLGEIIITDRYIKSLIAATVTECIGVVGMNGFGAKQKLKSLVKLGGSDTGIILKTDAQGELIIDLHITASYGTNISTVAHSIEDKVKYALESEADIRVRRVNTYVDDMKA